MHQSCVHKLWYSRNRNSREEKTFQKKESWEGEEPVAGKAPSDRSLTSGTRKKLYNKCCMHQNIFAFMGYNPIPVMGRGNIKEFEL
jgi:hypothetical protein